MRPSRCRTELSKFSAVIVEELPLLLTALYQTIEVWCALKDSAPSPPQSGGSGRPPAPLRNAPWVASAGLPSSPSAYWKKVRPEGLEPSTQWLRVTCSTNWAKGAWNHKLWCLLYLNNHWVGRSNPFRELGVNLVTGIYLKEGVIIRI